MKNKVVLFLNLMFLSPAVIAGVKPLGRPDPGAGEGRTGSFAWSQERWDIWKSEEAEPELCELGQEHREKVGASFQRAQDRLKSISVIQESLEVRAKDGSTADQLALKKEVDAAHGRALKDYRAAQLCQFRNELQAFVRNAIRDTTNKDIARDLEAVASCLARDPDQALGVRGTFRDFFQKIFAHYFRKKELNNEDCEVLKNTYALWAASYEEENSSAGEGSSANVIPAYNVNNHNASFYYWAQEQRRGRIPPEGLTVFHADTHTDMGHTHTHISHHWVGDLFDLRQVHELIGQPGDQMKGRIRDQIRERIKHTDRRNHLLQLTDTLSDTELRKLFEESVRRSVHHIAQPLSAAQYTGTANGRFVMCMPPWSKELPRSEYKEGADGASRPEALPFKLVKDRAGNAAFLMDCKDLPRGAWNIRCAEELAEIGQLIGESPFQVVNCNREIREEIGKDQNGRPVYKTSTGPAGFPYKDFFTEEDRKKGFLLDIDLDVFVSEGKGTQVEPISFERTVAHEKAAGKHGSHSMSNETDPAIQVTSREFGLIHGRIEEFFQGLADAKQAGYLPKVITIADSTALKRALAPTKLGEDSNSTDIQAFTPDCLAFIVNYLVRKKLKETYPEISFR